MLRKLDSCLAASYPAIRRELRPGATDAALKRLARLLSPKAKVPRALVQLLRWHDGSKGRTFLRSWAFHPITTILREHAGLGMLARMRPSAWQPSWWPLLGDGSGDFLCVDVAGSLGGKPGQIIELAQGAGLVVHASVERLVETALGLAEASVLVEDDAARFEAIYRKLNPGHPHCGRR